MSLLTAWRLLTYPALTRLVWIEVVAVCYLLIGDCRCCWCWCLPFCLDLFLHYLLLSAWPGSINGRDRILFAVAKQMVAQKWTSNFHIVNSITDLGIATTSELLQDVFPTALSIPGSPHNTYIEDRALDIILSFQKLGVILWPTRGECKREEDVVRRKPYFAALKL